MPPTRRITIAGKSLDIPTYSKNPGATRPTMQGPNPVTGKKTGLTFGEFMEDIFTRNELRDENGFNPPLTDHQIRELILAEFQDLKWVRDRMVTKKISVGSFRSKYNKRTLFAAQMVPRFVSLKYNEAGVPILKKDTPLTGEELFKMAKHLEIADPRAVCYQCEDAPPNLAGHPCPRNPEVSCNCCKNCLQKCESSK